MHIAAPNPTLHAVKPAPAGGLPGGPFGTAVANFHEVHKPGTNVIPLAAELFFMDNDPGTPVTGSLDQALASARELNQVIEEGEESSE